MAFSPKEMIDLTSDDDDDLQFIGTITCSTPERQPSNLKTPKSIQTQNKEQRQPKSMDKSSVTVLSQSNGTSFHSVETQLTTVNSLMNSKWDGFAESRHRGLSTFRTPSPCTQSPASYNHKPQIQELSPGERQRKRLREGILPTSSKRSLHSSPDLRTNEGDTGIICEGAKYDIYWESPSPRGRIPTEDELHHGVIVLEDDDDADGLVEISSRKWRDLSEKTNSRSMDPECLLIDLDDEEDRLLEEVRNEEEGMSSRKIPEPGRSGTVVMSRNLPITHPWTTKDSLHIPGGAIKTGSVMELTDSAFLRISIIMENRHSGEIKLRGCRLERSSNLNGILPKKANELCWHLQVELEDPRPPIEQGMEEISLAQVIGFKELRLTNQLFPGHSFRETGGCYDDWAVKHVAQCVARWTYSCKYRTARDRWHNRWEERCLEHLKSGDLSKEDRDSFIVDDSRLRDRYRGGTVLGGAYRALKRSINIKSSVVETVEKASVEPGIEVIRRSVSIIDLSEENDQVHTNNKERRADLDRQPQRAHTSQRHASPAPKIIKSIASIPVTPPSSGFICAPSAQSSELIVPKPSVGSTRQKYTYGDCFCGAGGATQGARMAGLKPIWGFDANKHACSSWRLNFPDAIIYEEWADQFIQRGLKNSDMKVDVLHLSPPCQYFSPAHTVDGKDDEMNMASLFACGMLLDVAKPRIATLEQTFGIVLLPRFQAYFNALIQMFTARGFSLRWKVAQLQNWGLPQRRQRLIIIASCPGEMLPHFPPFTHADPKTANSGLRPWVSVNSILKGIPRGAPNHDLKILEAKPQNYRPWSGESIAPRCITTHGGQNYHPSGKRGFTNREYACLQGFPIHHLFSEFNVKKQVGNAVPPSVAKVLFAWIKKALERVDGVQTGEFLPEDINSGSVQSGDRQTEAILID